jgi:hypothetical protein
MLWRGSPITHVSTLELPMPSHEAPETGKKPTIPRHEPEVLAAARGRPGEDKASTTAVGPLTYRGVTLSSRYEQADEYETLMALVDGVSRGHLANVKSIFCDSKSSHAYEVEVTGWSNALARLVGAELEAACVQRHGGHNGISVNELGNPMHSEYVNGVWNEG